MWMECKTKREKKKDAQLFFGQFRVQFVKNKNTDHSTAFFCQAVCVCINRQSVSVSLGRLCLDHQAVCVCIIRQSVCIISYCVCIIRQSGCIISYLLESFWFLINKTRSQFLGFNIPSSVEGHLRMITQLESSMTSAVGYRKGSSNPFWFLW